jgi:hypothetical protein
LSGVVNDANFADADALVDAQPVVTTGRAGSIEGDTVAPLETTRVSFS